MEDKRVRYLGCVLIAFCLAAIPTSDQPKLSPAEREILDVRNARTEASNNRDPEAWSATSPMTASSVRTRETV